MYEDFGKIFKPITEQQQKSSEEIVSKFAPLQKAIKNRPAQQALPWEPDLEEPQALELEEQPEALPAHDGGSTNVGSLARKYLTKSTKSTKEDQWDRAFGPKGDDEGSLWLGNVEFKTDGNNMIIRSNPYNGTQGLWELVTKKIPEKYSTDDLETYSKLIIPTNVMSTSEDINKPRFSKSYKWTKIMSHICDSVEAKKTSKSGISNGKSEERTRRQRRIKKRNESCEKNTSKINPGTSGQGFLPSDPNALCE